MPGPEKEILNLNIFFAIANSWGKNAGKVPRKLSIEVMCLAVCVLDAFSCSPSPLPLPELRVMCCGSTRSAESCNPDAEPSALPSTAGECWVAF